MAEKSKLKVYEELSPSPPGVGVFGASGILLRNDSPAVGGGVLGLGLMRLKFSTVPSHSVELRDVRLLVDDDCKEPLTFANARGCMLFLRLAPPRGMMVLSTLYRASSSHLFSRSQLWKSVSDRHKIKGICLLKNPANSNTFDQVSCLSHFFHGTNAAVLVDDMGDAYFSGYRL